MPTSRHPKGQQAVVITEGRIEFTFPLGWKVRKYDTSQHYLASHQKMRVDATEQGPKACDMVAINPDAKEVWLIEVKDFRNTGGTKPDIQALIYEITHKVRDSLVGMSGMARRSPSRDEVAFAVEFFKVLGAKGKLKVCAHLEIPTTRRLEVPQSRIRDELRLEKRLGSVVDLVEVSHLRLQSTGGWSTRDHAPPPAATNGS